MEKSSVILQKARQILVEKGWCQGVGKNEQGQLND